MVVYFLSGLGADKRAFQKLSLPENWTIIYLDWLDINDNETLETYTKRIAQAIDTSRPFSIVGLSFGGMVATELTKYIHPQTVVLISSISTKKELPVVFKLTGISKINRLIPSFFLNKIYPFTYWYFGVKTKAEKQLLQHIIHDTSPKFLKWAINEILNWSNNSRPSTIYHIHGSNDKVFPVENVKADTIVTNGGHFMVYSMADVISKLLIDKLQYH